MTIRMKALRKGLAAGALVAAGWLAVVLALTFVSPAGRAMAIVGDPAQAFAAVGGQRPVLSGRRYVTIARSDEPDFVARLYAAGALLVLDAEQAGGCSGRGEALRRVLLIKRVGEQLRPDRISASPRRSRRSADTPLHLLARVMSW